MASARVGRLEELPPGRCRSVRIGVRRIAVWNVGGVFYAMEDACRHMKAPLSTGRVEGTTLTCSWHGWKYDLTTGACHEKAWGCVRTFPVTIEDGVVMVSDEAIQGPGDDDGPDPEEIPTPIFRT
ncbi:MAG TPA: Rieske 2Fe-2S domain-containing protein [Candidatus Polarisedimenticolia bacterium]|nr:Rieske 2Fe-2S domain-containing protein [Candidatus Polarisedimenticolia bacterium]